MSKFTDTVKQDTPRLVVLFKREGDKEMFQWGLSGDPKIGVMPVVTLIGFLTRVQAELAFKAPDECPESSLVVTWDKGQRKFSYFVHPDIPVDSLVGMLETIKTALVSSQMAQQARNQQLILGPDGQPMRR